MRAERVLRFLILNGIAVGIGATVASSCISVNYPTVAFRCNPRQSDNCPSSHFCCSDDPAAQDGQLPAFEAKGITGGTPFFAGTNNALGTAGMCVRTDDIPVGSGLVEFAASNCPIPCNPTWGQEDKNTVCGTNRVCCQTVELEAADCVQGDDGTWRPATGADILVVPPRSDWGPARHATHQDPGGAGCMTFAGAGPGDPAFTDCVNNLSVADQRGFCMALGAGQACPTDAPGYLDACTQINMGLLPPPVAGAAPTTAAPTTGG